MMFFGEELSIGEIIIVIVVYLSLWLLSLCFGVCAGTVLYHIYHDEVSVALVIFQLVLVLICILFQWWMSFGIGVPRFIGLLLLISMAMSMVLVFKRYDELETFCANFNDWVDVFLHSNVRVSEWFRANASVFGHRNSNI